MRPVFYEAVAGPLPKRDRPYTTGLSLYLAFYEDGVQVNIHDHYEGRIDFDIPQDLMDITQSFLNRFAEANCIAIHQIQKVSSVAVRGTHPRGRYEVITETGDQTVREEEPHNSRTPPKRRKPKVKESDAVSDIPSGS